MARKARTGMDYQLTPVMHDASEGGDRGAAMAFFLLENTGSIFGHWWGQLPASEQRMLFGRFIGKGRIHINGDNESVYMTCSVCFGTMRDIVKNFTWRELL